MDKSVHHHHGRPDITQLIEICPMTLVGIRVNDTGNAFFLLQIWWSGKQFVEVSMEYMMTCEASLHFVITPQESDRHRFHSGRMRYAEPEDTIDLPLLSGSCHSISWSAHL